MVADPMKLCKHYYIATSIIDALESMGESSGNSEIIAGGTDILLDIQQGRHPPVHTLIDISAIPELTALEIRGDELFIGASVVHRRIHDSPIVSKHCYALKVASGLIGGPQVRNTATIGGNVAHALPAADGTIALMALDAKAEVVSVSERKVIPLEKLFLGPGRSTLKKNNEIIIGFYVNLIKTGQASGFKRIMRPQGVAIAILNTAVWLETKDNMIEDIRISVGPSGPIPKRMIKTENVLRNNKYSTETINQAQKTLLEEANFRTSKYRSTKNYREKMAGLLLRDTLSEAYERSLRRNVQI
jgi:carbon-monoxide dehydrogenase medium subunit